MSKVKDIQRFKHQSRLNASFVFTTARLLGLLDTLALRYPVSILLLLAGLFMKSRAIYGIIRFR